MIVASEEPCRSNTCAVIVTFHPDAELPERIEVAARQVDRVLIVDNHSNNESVAILEALARRLPLDLVMNEDNLGVATALNQGLRWAREHGYAWTLTLDQDSRLYDSAIEKFADIYHQLDHKESVAMIGSNFFDPCLAKQYYRKPRDGSAQWQEVPTVITSGTIMPMAACEVIGEFRDDLFIDHVDCEYCLRARSNGFRVIRATEALFEHTIGKPRTRKLLWNKKLIAGTPPHRWYYQARNLIALVRDYRRKEPAWVKLVIRIRLKGVRRIIFYEDKKLAKLVMIYRGIVDGLRGKMGPLG